MSDEPAKPAVGRNGRWEKLGEVGVDSASIGITDLLVGVNGSRCITGDPGARYATKGSKWAGDWGTGVRFWAGFGDGGYEVWGWIVDYGTLDMADNVWVPDERIAQVVVTMIDDDELASWRGL